MKSNRNESSHTYELLALIVFYLAAIIEIIVPLLRRYLTQFGINWLKGEL